MINKLLFLFIFIPFFFTGCMSLISTNQKTAWALSNGYILASDCPKVSDVPPREPQPHPKVPTIVVKDKDGNDIELTQAYLMETIITLFGTVEKYQVLVEIYEREYLNAGGKILPDLTLKQLKDLYKSRLAAVDNIIPVKEPTTEGEFPVTGAASSLTVEQFESLIKAYNYFQANGDTK